MMNPLKQTFDSKISPYLKIQAFKIIFSTFLHKHFLKHLRVLLQDQLMM
jgi:hypothetical protein